jgi:hypothetical protein
MSIKISYKHGANPSIEKCFWCGGDKGIVLLGRLPNDKEAPKESILNYVPCDTCKEKLDSGFTIIEVESTKESTKSAPEIIKGFIPTGNLWVIATESAKELFPGYDTTVGGGYITKQNAENKGLYDV